MNVLFKTFTIKSIVTAVTVAFSAMVSAQINLVGVVAGQSSSAMRFVASPLSTGTVYTLPIYNSSNIMIGFNMYDSNLDFIDTELFPVQFGDERYLYHADGSGISLELPYTAGILTNSMYDSDPTTVEYAYILVNNSTGKVTTAICRVGAGVLYYFNGPGQGGYFAIRQVLNRPEGTRLVMNYLRSSSALHIVYDLGGEFPCTDCDGNIVNIVGGNEERLEDFQPIVPKSFNMFPNPADETLSIEFDFPEDVQQAELVVMNTVGQEVKRLRLNEVELQQVSISDLAPSSYLCTLFKEDGELLAPGQMLVVE